MARDTQTAFYNVNAIGDSSNNERLAPFDFLMLLSVRHHLGFLNFLWFLLIGLC